MVLNNVIFVISIHPIYLPLKCSLLEQFEMFTFRALTDMSNRILLSTYASLLFCIILNQYLLDEMGARIDELELSINDLKAEMGSDGMTPTKVKDEESKPADSSS